MPYVVLLEERIRERDKKKERYKWRNIKSRWRKAKDGEG